MQYVAVPGTVTAQKATQRTTVPGDERDETEMVAFVMSIAEAVGPAIPAWSVVPRVVKRAHGLEGGAGRPVTDFPRGDGYAQACRPAEEMRS